jgi:hypothetical protein
VHQVTGGTRHQGQIAMDSALLLGSPVRTRRVRQPCDVGPAERWSSDGAALVIDESGGWRMAAHSMRGFNGLIVANHGPPWRNTPMN